MASASGDPTSNPAAYPLDTCNLEVLIKKKLEKQSTTTKLPSICKIPKHIRSVNDNAYTPIQVAIGPYHANDLQLQPMEPYKVTYLASLMSRGCRPPEIQLQEYIAEIEKGASEAWRSYSRHQELESSGLTREKFKLMLLLDGAFIVELFCRDFEENIYREGPSEPSNEWKASISRRGYVGTDPDPLSGHAMKLEALRDLILLENQLPYFILESLFDLTFPRKEEYNKPLTFAVVAHFCLSFLIPMRTGPELTYNEVQAIRRSEKNVAHLVHLLRMCCLPHPDDSSRPSGSSTPTTHCWPSWVLGAERGKLKFLCLTLSFSYFWRSKHRDDEHRCVSVTELHDVGVRFKSAEGGYRWFNIWFNEAKAVIELPRVTFDHLTETFFRNLMAFEQYYLNKYEISSYMCFMDRIIDTQRDVDILERSQVIENWLDSKESIAKICNGMSMHTIFDFHEYDEVSRKITAYARKPWNKWRAMLSRDYFGSPWAIISLIAALVLLAFTALQTVATVLSTKW